MTSRQAVITPTTGPGEHQQRDDAEQRHEDRQLRGNQVDEQQHQEGERVLAEQPDALAEPDVAFLGGNFQ
jgi:hypothetical protein